MAVVKKLTEFVLNDYGGGIFCKEYEQEHMDTNSEINGAASYILKPIQDLSANTNAQNILAITVTDPARFSKKLTADFAQMEPDSKEESGPQLDYQAHVS